MESNEWKFDANVAKVFAQHANQHISHYQQVLNKTLDICNAVAEKESPIVDFGCATGATLELLYNNNFRNLYGIDNSRDMLNLCPANIAKLQCTDQLQFADNFFKVIICNWTLHFIKDKASKLQEFTRQLQPGGVLIISEKVSLDPIIISLYHQMKRLRGVSEQEIAEKAKSIKDVMFINDVSWYLKLFEQLNLTAHVIDADYAFATFMCVKPTNNG